MKLRPAAAAIAAMFAYLDRSTCAILGGVAALLASVVSSWYPVPAASLSAVGASGNLEIREHLLPEEILLRLVLGGFAAVVLASLARPRLLLRLRYPAYVLLAACLALPYLVNQWHPDVLMDGRMVFLQIDRVAEDMDGNLNEQQTAWRDWEDIGITIRRRVFAIQPPYADDWTMRLIEMNKQLDITENILGLSVVFFNLAGLGWYLGLAGLLTLLLALYAAPGIRL